ncbi:MAG: Gfo/Idh/MocA family oxidoreductase [Planctomycetes bacterium]|nr:Gfo/Idh/MocA family oxidoreductase [Planctomycetota bacterium]
MKRTVVIGARRERQGIGEFVARALAHAGAEIVAVVGRSDASAEEARRTLAARYGIRCRAYGSAAAALEREAPEIVAICSPFRLHAEHLALAAEARAHCLCEKPMWWPERMADLARGTAALVDSFLARERRLALVTQWPQTLPWFYRLYPSAEGERLTRFEMELAPDSTGAQAVLDSLPHVLSMLQALTGTGAVADARADFARADRRELLVDFVYKPATIEALSAPERSTSSIDVRSIDVHCRLVTCSAPPRPAAYALNGRRVDREIALPAYTMSLRGEGSSVELVDPLELLAREFMEKTQSAAPANRQALEESVTLLAPLWEAVRKLEDK